MSKNLLKIIIFLFLIHIISCRKDKFITDSNVKLKFSEDTIIFDTIFTTVGSVTKRFKVYNIYNQKILISKIWIGGGKTSFYRINVDGIPGTVIKNIEILPKDSLYIFVEVTIDPLNSNNPLIVSDSILFETNGNVQDVDLVAWGQDAHFFYPDTYIKGLPPFKVLNCNEHWINDKPYVIYGYVVIDSTCSLTIDPGTKIYFHKNSGLWVYRYGQISVNGTLNNPVIFQGDRLDIDYREIPGQWDRIWINEGNSNNVFNYAIIKNSFIGIQCETFPFDPSIAYAQNILELNNCKILNSSGIGLFSKNYNIYSYNSIIANSGQYNFAVTGGGSYKFFHCTFANYWTQTDRKTPAVFLSNYYEDINGNIQVRDIDSCIFYNSIIHGSNDNEFDTDKNNAGNLNFLFHYCVLKTNKNTSSANFVNIIKNPSENNGNPLFVDEKINNYHLKSNSAAINVGDINIANIFPVDLDGNSRIADNNPDAGAYEYLP